MSQQDKAVLFNAIPLLVLAGACLGVTAALVLALWRERARATAADYALAVVFPLIGIPALVLGVRVLTDHDAPGGRVWLTLAGIVIALVPAVLMLTRLRDRRLIASGARRLREAEARVEARDLELEAVARISKALARTSDAESAGRTLLQEVSSVLGVEYAALSVVDETQTEARGLVGWLDGQELDWWRGLRLDLRQEPSGIASAVFDGAPVSIYDIESSSRVSRSLAERLHAKSGAFVPLVTDERVIGVLVAATTTERRLFGSEEIALMEALAAEAALALERTRSADALARAVDRERLVAEISRKVRSELDVDAVIRVAVTETGRALRSRRCFIRLSAPDWTLPTEWHEPGVDPITPEAAVYLPVTNLAARELRTVVVVDTSTDPAIVALPAAKRDELRKLGARSALATPVVVFDRVVGVLTVHRSEPGPWSSGEVALAEAVAGELGLAIHTARLLRENERRIAEQASLLRAAQVVTSDLRLRTVLDSLVMQLAELVQADGTDCYLFDPERGVLRCAAVHGLPQSLVGWEFTSGRGLTGRAIARGRPVRSEDYGELGDEIPHEEYQGFASAIVAPMTWGDEVRGVVGAGTRDPERSFGQSETDLVEAFANLVSIAIRNAESYEQSSRQARIQRGFYRIASALAEPLSLQQTFDALAQAAGEALGASAAAVLVPVRGRLELAAAYELPPKLAAAFAAGLDDASAALIGAAEARRVVAAGALEGDERFDEAWRAPALESGCRAVLAVPFEAPKTDEAGLVVAFFEEERRFSDDDLELAGHLAGAARGALERSELFEAERTSRALAQQLARSGSLLATELDPEALLDDVVAQAPALLGAQACSIRLVEGDELVVSAASGEGAEASIGTRALQASVFAGDVIQSRLPVAVADVSTERRAIESDPLLAGHVAYLGVPLIGPEGGVQGVLAVYDRAERTWRPEEIEALSALASNASAALSNAELYQRVALEKERSVAIIANIADGIVAVDRDGRVVLWNAAAERITGVPTAEALGQTPEQLLRRELRSEGGAAPGDRLVSIRRGEDEIWLSLTEAVMRDPAGQVAGRIFAFRDISAERAVDDMKSTFVSTVSHELRTPLTSIYGFAETLLREDVLFDDDQRRTFLLYIASESERLSLIVDQLLSVARLEHGDLEVTVEPTDVRGVVREAVDTAQLTEPNGHRFVVEVPPEPLDACADREKLRQILGNLIDNAIRFSPSGATVTVAARRAGDNVELRVDDEGDGIPTGDQGRIFSKFSPGARPGGTGMSLFIARGLVNAMGGRISVTSRQGAGSSFLVELPAAED